MRAELFNKMQISSGKQEKPDVCKQEFYKSSLFSIFSETVQVVVKDLSRDVEFKKSHGHRCITYPSLHRLIQ